ncbi:3-deoxy-7-phosphoheptulonate synthase [Streptomyces sp. SID2888]|uniref:3-deoxy-7-phosphoheptulonate synthase n=1 Tax=Streptomyces sp. SID2888 TaxID=2690256 RepID=UPI001F18C6B3|nr:3-deoxy-7-phosphoheptulonate synthase [Streptomyces sp. SID2888]
MAIAVLPAAQQPNWPDTRLLDRVRANLLSRPGLVTVDHTARLRELLGHVVAGRMRIVQAGDCAEDPAECTPDQVSAKTVLLDELARAMREASGHPVLRIGRMAGQFAKPRSRSVEHVDGLELPVYRGPMVNDPEPDATAREPDPRRLLAGYDLSSSVLTALAAQGRGPASSTDTTVWTSHEALLLDYELSLLRGHDNDAPLLASTHLPWVGERTRRPDGAHVRLLARVINPVACKVGPGTTVEDLLALCARLDPHRDPGRLTLIARMGATRVHERLPPLVRAVRDAGHPVIWLCDPMHGNTVRAADGRKTRTVAAITAELGGFQDAVLAEHGVAGGVHLEATPHPVAECVRELGEEPGTPYTTLCDPRLNLAQAREVVSAWCA